MDNLNKNQKIIIAAVGPILIFVIAYWMAIEIETNHDEPFDFTETGIIWVLCVIGIGALEWFLFGRSKETEENETIG